MSFPEAVRSLLATRAASDPDAAKLLEMFQRADANFERVPDGAVPADLSTAKPVMAARVGDPLPITHVQVG